MLRRNSLQGGSSGKNILCNAPDSQTFPLGLFVSSIPATSMPCISMRVVMALATTGESLMLLSVALLFPSFSQASTLCYHPNGDLNDDLTCDPSAANSACCPRYWTFLSNRLCTFTNSTGDIKYGRFSCTDKSWNSPTCPQFCLAGVAG